MDKEKIISYVMETPGNTNPNVLRSLLDEDGGGLPPVTSEDNGKVLTADQGVWTPMGELKSANNFTILANVEQDGSLSTYNTINFLGAQYLYNRGCLFVEIYRNGSSEQTVKCDFAADIAGGLAWVFRGNYIDTLSGKIKTIDVYFTPPQSPESTPASITIINIDANLPSVTSSDNGKVLGVVDGEWVAVGKDLDTSNLVNTRIQPIPVLYNPNPGDEEFYFDTELRPQDIVEGYSLPYIPPYEEEETEVTLNVPSLQASSYAVAYVYTSDYPWESGVRVSLLLVEVARNIDGPILQSGVFDLSGLGMTGMVGYLVLEPYSGYNVPYRCSLVAWSATIM